MGRNAICLCVLGICASLPVAAMGGSLQFNPNDLFNYAVADGTRLDQLGTARNVPNNVTGRYYLTYNDAASGRDAGATAAQDLQSVANILEFSAFAGFQGVSHVQLWLAGGNAKNWGEAVLMKPYSTLTASVNGEYDWTASVEENPWDATPDDGTYEPGTDEYGIAHFNTELGGTDHQNALSPDFNPADELWTVTGDFYEDVNGNGAYDPGVDNDLVLGQDYTLWFSAVFNNWRVADDYGNDMWGGFTMEGSLQATAIPEPATLIGALGGLLAAGGYVRRRRAC